jgi:ribosomal protein S18 acetylase RimI-like enzyme
MRQAVISVDDAIERFIAGFARLQSFVGPVERGESHGIPYLYYTSGRRGLRYTHEFYVLDVDPERAIPAAREIAGDSPHMIDVLGSDQDGRMAGYEAVGYASWGRETIMARELATFEPGEPTIDIRSVEDIATAERIVRAQFDAIGRAHPVTAAHIADPAVIDRWVAIDGEFAAFARVALIDGDAYCSDVVTLPNYRRRGLGVALVRQLLVDARAAGAERCVLSATAMATELYRGLGFVEITPLIGFHIP